MYEKRSNGWLKHLDFIIVDMVSLQLAFLTAYAVRFGMRNPYADKDYRSLSIVLLLIDFGAAIFFKSFKNVLKRDWDREFAAVIRHVLLVEGLALLYLFSTQMGGTYSRIFFYVMIPLYIGFSYLARLCWKKILKRQGNTAASGKSLLILAPASQLEETIRKLSGNSYSSWLSLGAVAMDADLAGTEIAGVPVVAAREKLLDYVRREWVDEVFLATPPEKGWPVGLIADLKQMGIVVHIAIAAAEDIGTGRKQVERLGSYTVLTTGLACATSRQLLVKRSIDIVGGFVGCLITIVLFLFLAPVIYFNSPGSIFFSQERVGRNGRRFRMYKFRTMYPDAEERKQELMAQNRVKDGHMFKLDYDPRIIGSRRLQDGTVKKGIGSFMREKSLDEFPQMFNVLKGDMSLVGTRPPTVDEWEKYEPHHRARLAFRPGLTGLWQVSGRSSITDFEEVVKLDTEYIDKWSIGLDIKILMKTIGVMLFGKGAM